jgi:hypothetical protein
LTEALTDRIAIGIVVGLVVGKTVGIFATSYLVARFTRATLNPDLRWVDLLGVAALAGIGFTVSLLIGELAYGVGGGRDEYVKIGVWPARYWRQPWPQRSFAAGTAPTATWPLSRTATATLTASPTCTTRQPRRRHACHDR